MLKDCMEEDRKKTEIFGYKKLIAYQKAQDLVREIYKLIEEYHSVERYALCDQLRRASFSVTSNIAEGVNRFSNNDKARFIEMSFGSLMEISSQLDISEKLGYISKEKINNMEILIKDTARLLAGLYRSYKSAEDKSY